MPVLTSCGPWSSPRESDDRKGVAVIGAVQGDIHDIGKNLVKMMLEVSGIEVHDLGRDVEMEKFIEEAQRVDADLLCLSALMTTTIIAIKDYMPEFKAKLPRTKIMIGGAPLNQHLADEWGADGYGENAMEAARVAAGSWRRPVSGQSRRPLRPGARDAGVCGHTATVRATKTTGYTSGWSSKRLSPRQKIAPEPSRSMRCAR